MSTSENSTVKKGMTPTSLTFKVTPVETLRKRSSLRPKNSIFFKVKSLRPTRTTLGKFEGIISEEKSE